MKKHFTAPEIDYIEMCEIITTSIPDQLPEEEVQEP